MQLPFSKESCVLWYFYVHNSFGSSMYVLGNSSDLWCTDNCSTEGKHTDTIFYVVRQNRLHAWERQYYLEIEKGLQKYMEEDHIHSTPISHCPCSCCNDCCHCSSLFLSNPFTCSHSLSSHVCSHAFFIGKSWSMLRGQYCFKLWHELWHNSCCHL